jgi:penicillin-binding protein 2
MRLCLLAGRTLEAIMEGDVTATMRMANTMMAALLMFGAAGCRCNTGSDPSGTGRSATSLKTIDDGRLETAVTPAKRGTIRDAKGRALATSRVARTDLSEYSRIYPMGPVGAHVIGYMDGATGKGGIEETFDAALAGKPGWSRTVMDENGAPIDPEVASEIVVGPLSRKPEDGFDVHTTIDSDLMVLVHRTFSQHDAGAAVVIEVGSGRVLGLYSKPSFDPTSMTRGFTGKQREELEDDPLLPMLDRTIGEPLTPGSTFKTFTALAALQSGAVTAKDTIPCKGSVKVGDEVMTCHGTHGKQTIVDCITVSCNACFYQLGLDVGLDPLFDLYRSLGFGKATRIPLPSESPGFLPDEQFTVDAESYPVLAASTASGHGPVKVTLLQLALAYAAILNGGKLYEPLLVEKITQPSGTLVERFDPKVVATIPITDEVRSTLIEAMKTVVASENGTAFGAGLDDVVVGGKSGTDPVQPRIVPEGQEGDELPRVNNTFFVAFAPADAPQVLVVVLVEDGLSGGRTAAPIAIRILGDYLAGLD